jgi:hypothetical protein
MLRFTSWVKRSTNQQAEAGVDNLALISRLSRRRSFRATLGQSWTGRKRYQVKSLAPDGDYPMVIFSNSTGDMERSKGMTREVTISASSVSTESN